MISMKGLVDYFAQAPFGYTDSDTKWLLAKLFREAKIGAAVDKEPISLFNREPDELGNYLTSRRYEEKILFRSKETIDPKRMKDCRDVMKELFHRTEVGTDSEKLMASFKSSGKELLGDLNEMLAEQRHEPKFPGKETLTEAVRILVRVAELQEETAFYHWVSKEKSRLLGLAEELAPVMTFYTSETQQKIFQENGLRALQFYDNGKEHITDGELKFVAEAIRKIVDSKAPYELIRKLPGMYEQFKELYGKALDEKLIPVKQVIEADEEAVLHFIRGQAYAEMVKGEVRAAFSDLAERAAKEGDISNLLGFKDRADSLCRRFLDRFADMTPRGETLGGEKYPGTEKAGGSVEETPLGEKFEAKPKKMKNLMARDMTSGYWVVSRKEDLEHYLEQIRARVESEMDENTIIRIQF